MNAPARYVPAWRYITTTVGKRVLRALVVRDTTTGRVTDALPSAIEKLYESLNADPSKAAGYRWYVPTPFPADRKEKN